MVRLFELLLSNLPIALVIAGLIFSMAAAQKKRKQQARQEQEGQTNAQPAAWGSAVLPPELEEEDEEDAEFSAWNLPVDADDAPPPGPPKLEPPPREVKPMPLRAAGKPMPLGREAQAEPARERPRFSPFPPVITELPLLQQAAALAVIFGPPKGMPVRAEDSTDYLDFQ
ncbi:MAG: hypothetical protein LBD37_09900 [Treponema sp.]|jgi:hypothetical protein|nr:hypothetical protein [Treponema sp.]